MSNTYHRIIRKLVVGFGNVFNNITLTRYNTDGSEDRRVKVPIIYSPKEKYVARLVGDPELNKKVQVTLPRMSFDLVSMEYDSTRKQVTNSKNYAPSGNPSTKLVQYNPVPYTSFAGCFNVPPGTTTSGIVAIVEVAEFINTGL